MTVRSSTARAAEPVALAAPLALVRPVALTVQFTVQAEAEPSVLPRVLEPFARRNLVPLAVHCRRERSGMRIEVTVAGLEAQAVEHLTRRLNQLVPVETVLARLAPTA